MKLNFAERLKNRLRQSLLRDVVVRARYRGVTPRDVFLASYPKSGSTWLSFMLAQILAGEEQERCDPDSPFVPGIGRHGRALRCLPGAGRLIRTHEQYRPPCRRAIVLLRDGRDVAVSYYFHQIRQCDIKMTFSEFLPHFIQGSFHGYGSWQAHTASWLNSTLAETSSLLLVRYEDMKGDCAGQLRRIASFLGVHPENSMIEAAVRANQFAAMREKEQRGALPEGKVKGVYFVRSGTCGDWKKHFDGRDLALFLDAAGDALRRLGYSVDTPPELPTAQKNGSPPD